MDDAEARAILREHGEDPPKRGQLGGEWRERAEAYRAGADELTAAGPLPDDAGAGQEAAAGEVEHKPRRVRQARPTLADRLRAGRSKGGTRRRPARAKHPRVSVAEVCGSAWYGLARVAANVDIALSRCLQLQSGVAGEILEDIAKDTFVDTLLQPVARGAEKGKKAAALLGPPMLTTAIRAAEGLPEPQRSIRLAFLVPLLEESLVMMARVTGDMSKRVTAKIEEEAPLREMAKAQVQLIFADLVPAAAEPSGAAA